MFYFPTTVSSGLGFGINYTGCMAGINAYFDKYKTVALGLASVGHNLGLSLYAEFIVLLQGAYGWRGMMLILGAIAFHMCAFAFVMMHTRTLDRTPSKKTLKSENQICAEQEERIVLNTDHECTEKLKTSGNPQFRDPSRSECQTGLILKSNPEKSLYISSPETGNSEQESKPEVTSYSKGRKENDIEADFVVIDQQQSRKRRACINISVFRKLTFLCFCLSNIFVNTSQGIYILHLPSYSREAGFTENDFSVLWLVYGISNIGGKVVYSFMGQHPKCNSTIMYTVSLTICGVIIGLTPIFLTKSGILVTAGFVGFFYCVTGALIQAVTFNIVGYERFADGVGMSLPFKGTGNLIGGPLAGMVHNLTCLNMPVNGQGKMAFQCLLNTGQFITKMNVLSHQILTFKVRWLLKRGYVRLLKIMGYSTN